MSEHIRAGSIIRSANVGSLGTLSPDGGPFVSLVTVAASRPTSVVMLLSGLAVHTRNLAANRKSSLLLAESRSDADDPLAGARVTLIGSAAPLKRGQDAQARDVFLSRHPSASMYADFADFAFFEFDVRQAHLVAGFGQIVSIPASDLQ